MFGLTLILGGGGCSSTPVGTTPTLWEMIQGTLSDVGTQSLIDLKQQTEATRSITTVLDKFSDNNLSWIKAELVAVARIAKQLNIPMETPVTLTSEQRTFAAEQIKRTEDFYINKHGWMSLDPLGPTQDYTNENPTYFMAQYFWILKRLGLFTPEMKAKYLPKLTAQINAMELQPGLYDRFAKPRAAEINPFSHDESQGICHLDSLFDFQIGSAKAHNEYGKKHDYAYFNMGWSALDTFNHPLLRHGQIMSKASALILAQRYGGQTEIIRRTAGEPASTASDLLICADMLSSVRDDCTQTSIPILNLMRAKFMMGQSEVLDGCILQFQGLLQNHFKRGKTCGGKVVETDNAYTAMARIYYNLPQDHPIYLLSTLLPPGAG